MPCPRPITLVNLAAAAVFVAVLATAVTRAAVAASPVAIECAFVDERSFGGSTVVFGEVLHIAVSPEVLRDGEVAPDLLAPVARLGGSLWSELGTVFDLARIPVEEYEPHLRASGG